MPGTATSLGHHTDVNQIARTLAAHGGGAVSFDLALDLVLNEFVQLARDATGATGAAIALARDGEMVCRATTGGNAPDLGVRVESASGLSGTCLHTGEAQLCSDTETDPRVDAAACRRLGVRSMLMAPIQDGQQCLGILEVFSSRANAFGQQDIETLQGLARKIADNQKGPVATREPVWQEYDRRHEEIAEQPEPEADILPVDSEPITPADSKGRDIWNSVLVILVIVAAVSLGLLMGWRAAKKSTAGSSQPAARTSPTANVNPAEQTGNSAPPASAILPTPETVVPPKAGHNENAVESGGLVVTQNGKVIYRLPPAGAGGTQATAESSKGRLIHRVEPEYPAQAKAQGIQGSVVLEVQILTNGLVGNINVESGDPVLADAAVAAIKQWRYEPMVVDGQPAESQTRVTVKFTLPQS